VHVFAGSLDELCSPCTSALLADTFKLGTLHLMRGVGHISGMMEGWKVYIYFLLYIALHRSQPSFVLSRLQDAFILASGSNLPITEHGAVVSV
jgi:hypothetical protein